MVELDRATGIAGVVIVTPDVHADARGLFVETFRHEWVPGSSPMVQANRGDRQRGALVGLHYHLRQADFWYVPEGLARVVLHDLRLGSPTEGATMCFELGREEDGSHRHRGVYIPRGVAHGFAALTDLVITYLVDHYYDPDDELGVAWDDPSVGARWGVTDPVLSPRDQANPRRSDLSPSRTPRYEAAPGLSG